MPLLTGFPRNIKDRNVQYPKRYKLTPVAGQADTYDLDKVPGTVTEEGTPINKGFLDSIDQGLFDAYFQSGATPIDGITTDLIYTGSVLTSIDEKITATSKLFRRTTLIYTNGVLSSINTKIYASDGTTVTKEWTDTLTITNSVLELVTRSVIV